MTVAALKTDFGVPLTRELPLLQGWQCVLDETYSFIHTQVLPPFGWALFENTLEKYQTHRRAQHTADIDVFPIAACLVAGGAVAQALPVAASWALYVFAGRQFDDLADGEGEAKNLFTPPTTARSLSACLFANSAANAALWHLTDKTVASQAIGCCQRQLEMPRALFDIVLLPFPVAITLMTFIPTGYLFVIYRKGLLGLDPFFSRVLYLVLMSLVVFGFYTSRLYRVQYWLRLEGASAVAPATIIFFPTLLLTLSVNKPLSEFVQWLVYGDEHW